MKQEILDRRKVLGGNIDQVKGDALQEDILSITFDTVLYHRTEDTPWAEAGDQEPIYGIGDFVEENRNLFDRDKTSFYQKIVDKYYCLTEEGFGQTFWKNELFTPFKEGTSDFEEWNEDFIDEEEVDLSQVIALTKNPMPDFVQLFYDYGFPDHLYICLSDPNPENPTVFGTDHVEFFREISNKGTLETYLNQFMTKEELLDIVKAKLEAS